MPLHLLCHGSLANCLLQTGKSSFSVSAHLTDNTKNATTWCHSAVPFTTHFSAGHCLLQPVDTHSLGITGFDSDFFFPLISEESSSNKVISGYTNYTYRENLENHYPDIPQDQNTVHVLLLLFSEISSEVLTIAFPWHCRRANPQPTALQLEAS